MPIRVIDIEVSGDEGTSEVPSEIGTLLTLRL